MASGESPSSLMVSERKRPEAEVPPGFRFCPYHWELIQDYLKNKNEGFSLHIHIPVVDLYNCHPERLQVGDFKYAIHNEKYYFTRRVHKNRRGSQVKRSMAEGYWKTTSKDIDITDKKNNKIGYLKKFKFYEGKDKKPTNWFMHEFRDLHTVSPMEATTSTENWTNRYVLCKIYEKRQKHSTDSPTFTSAIEEVRESSIPENNPTASQPHQTSSLLLNMIQFQTHSDDNNFQHHLSTEVGLPIHPAGGTFNESSLSQELLDCNDNGAEGSSIPQNTCTASYPHQTSLLLPNMNQFCNQAYENNIQDNPSTKEGLDIHWDENIGNIHESFVSKELLDCNDNGAEGCSIPQNTCTASHPHQTSLLLPNMNQFCNQAYENNIQDNPSTKEGLDIHRDENIGNIHESFVSKEFLDYDINDPLRYWNEPSGEEKLQQFSLNTDTMVSGLWSY